MDLAPWPPVLDALAATKTGEVSAVVETQFGFHVFRRESPPPPQRVAGRRIVIGHSGTSWLQIVGRPGRSDISRTRDDAWVIAKQVAERARKAPAEFARLVDEYSEHRDARDGGDLGLWSNQEPTYLRREMAILAGLKVGEIAEPIDRSSRSLSSTGW